MKNNSNEKLKKRFLERKVDNVIYFQRSYFAIDGTCVRQQRIFKIKHFGPKNYLGKNAFWKRNRIFSDIFWERKKNSLKEFWKCFGEFALSKTYSNCLFWSFQFRKFGQNNIFIWICENPENQFCRSKKKKGRWISKFFENPTPSLKKILVPPRGGSRIFSRGGRIFKKNSKILTTFFFF